MAIPYYVECILNKYKITDYLASKGITPARQTENKIFYKCPLHSEDNTPSFVVFTDQKHENYYCFGCHSGSTIINLVSEFEKISFKQSFKKLIENIDIGTSETLSSILEDTDKLGEDENNWLNAIEGERIDEIVLKINQACYFYLKDVTDFDEEEMSFFNQIFKNVDRLSRSRNYIDMIEAYQFIVEKGIPYRGKLYLEKMEKRGGEII